MANNITNHSSYKPQTYKYIYENGRNLGVDPWFNFG